MKLIDILNEIRIIRPHSSLEEADPLLYDAIVSGLNYLTWAEYHNGIWVGEDNNPVEDQLINHKWDVYDIAEAYWELGEGTEHNMIFKTYDLLVDNLTDSILKGAGRKFKVERRSSNSNTRVYVDGQSYIPMGWPAWLGDIQSITIQLGDDKSVNIINVEKKK